MADEDFVSNEMHEIEAVAKKFGIKPSQVLEAKEKTGSNLRYSIEKYIVENFVEKDGETK